MRKVLLSLLLVVALVGLTPSRAHAQLFRRWRSGYYYPGYYYPGYYYSGYNTPAYVPGYSYYPYASYSYPTFPRWPVAFGMRFAPKPWKTQRF